MNMRECPECGAENVVYMSQKRQAVYFLVIIIPIIVFAIVRKINAVESDLQTPQPSQITTQK